MIYEYAIEPELVVAWGKNRADYRYFYEQFGLGTPRIMAEYPSLKNWRKQFKHAIAGADETNELPRITAMFNMLKERLILREGINYDGNRSWLENAEAENNRQNFQAVLAQSNPRSNPNVLESSSVETNPLWRLEKQGYCPRQANHMAQKISVMLSNCSEVHFIDPYFGENIEKKDKYSAPWIKPFTAFLEIIATNRTCRPTIKIISIHTSTKAEFTFFKQTCKNKLMKQIPAGLRITIQCWEQRYGSEKIHNRYILTDIGGVKIDPGLNESITKGDTFEVILLERTLYEKQWSDYIINPAFNLFEEPFEIVGKNE